MKFYSPEYFFFLLIPVIVFFLWKVLNVRRVCSIEKNFSEDNIKDFNLLNHKRDARRWICRGLFLTGYVFFVLALSRPQFGQKQKTMLISENSVVFLIDLSRSMLTRDIVPSRLGMVKQEIFRTLKVLGDIRVGLVVFAGSVDVISPMTSDLRAVESYVDSLSVDSVLSQGTKVQVGLEEVKKLFERSLNKNEGNKLIILFSDGETHEKESLSYAKKMSKLNYKLFTVGVGTESGGFVPESANSTAYIKDVSGQVVVSKPNFKFLKKLASVGNGAFYYLSPTDPLGPKIKKSLDQIEGVAAARKKFIVRNEAFQGFIVIGLLVWVFGLAVRRF